MAIDKSRTPVWMKVVLIAVALTFVLGFCSMAGNPFNLFAPQGQQGGAGSTDPVLAVNQRHQGNVSTLTGQLQSDPESYTVLVALGNSYFDWALELQSMSATNSAAQGADLPMWSAAKDAYSRALAINGKESGVRVDYAITLFYSGDTNEAVRVATEVTKDDPDFSMAWFNLGVFQRALEQTSTAIASFERYLKLEPNGQNVSYAQQSISELKGTATAP